GSGMGKIYVVQTNEKIIQRCMLMASDPGDLILDITCGSGTSAKVAENWGRRWITCDTSRIAVTLAKQRLLTELYEYYLLNQPNQGISSGFRYKSLPRITLKSIANNEQPKQEIFYDQPLKDNSKVRVTGPFTVESVPAPTVRSLDEQASTADLPADESVSRSGETLRQDEWQDELLRTGVQAKGGAKIEFSRLETQEGTRHIQAIGETKGENPKRVFVIFGPEHAPMEQRQVDAALDEVSTLRPKPDMVLFCAYQFDEEAAKDIDETKFGSTLLLRSVMNMDLQTEDLKKNSRSSQSFWLVGSPDVIIRKDAEDANKHVVEVKGFDYYDPRSGEVKSGTAKNIAMWMLDPDYDGRSLFPTQIFFPMAGAKEGWAKLAKTLKAEIDTDKIAAFRGTVSLPFKAGTRVGVKIIDDRGIESLKILYLHELNQRQ
ncbi:MAG: DNA methyltransferase, partial [Bacteroidota bacterium]